MTPWLTAEEAAAYLRYEHPSTHTSEQMTQRYAGVRLEDKRAVVVRLLGEEE